VILDPARQAHYSLDPGTAGLIAGYRNGNLDSKLWAGLRHW